MSAPAIVFCAWCKAITIPAGITGCALVFTEEGMRCAYVNGTPTDIADGICQSCRATKFAGFPKKPFGGKRHDLSSK
jgi:hypothetical protein